MGNVNGEKGGEWGLADAQVADAQVAASVACSSAQKKKERASAFPATSAHSARLTAVLSCPQDSWVTWGQSATLVPPLGRTMGRPVLPGVETRCLLCKEISTGITPH